MTDPHTLPPLSFAPLEGITGWIFRQVHHAMFPGLSRYYTPFFAPTADSPLTGRGLRDMHPDHNRGVPVVPQLLTNRAEDFIASARLLQDLGYKEVNLNLGCPSGTVVAKKKPASGAGTFPGPNFPDPGRKYFHQNPDWGGKSGGVAPSAGSVPTLSHL